MHLILRILKFDILRVPPIRISTKRSTHSSKIWLCVARKIKISECQSICNMWQVYTRPTCASDFLKNEFRAKKKFPSVTRHCRGFLDEIWGAASSAVLSARKLKFWLPASFEPTWCTSYSEFWNSFKKLRSPKI
jgi:hypothetical protein